MTEKRIYDVVVIGGGPAGLTASIYCKRSGLNVLVVEKGCPGGKIIETPLVENIPGFPAISGEEFGMKLSDQAEVFGVEFEFDEVQSLSYDDAEQLHIVSMYGEKVYSKSVIISTGTINRTLGLDGEDELIGKGISFCATCDGPFYKNKDIIVVGGGNSAITEVIELASICNSVTIIQNLPTLTAEQTILDRLNKLENVNIVYNATMRRYLAQDGKLSGIEFDVNDVIHTINCDGVFLAVGLIPNTKIFENYLKLDDCGYIQIDDRNRTSHIGVFACGDCVHNTIKQVAVACGEGAKTGVQVINYLKGNGN